jgi:hypothetical protein
MLAYRGWPVRPDRLNRVNMFSFSLLRLSWYWRSGQGTWSRWQRSTPSLGFQHSRCSGWIWLLPRWQSYKPVFFVTSALARVFIPGMPIQPSLFNELSFKFIEPSLKFVGSGLLSLLIWGLFMQLGFNWVTDKESSSILIYFETRKVFVHREMVRCHTWLKMEN